MDSFRILLILAVFPLLFRSTAIATINFGGDMFHDDAFADDAFQIGPGTVAYAGGARSVKEALAGFSPGTGLLNIGFNGNANLFQLDFKDIPATNGQGNDIAFYTAGHINGGLQGRDPYEIAVREVGGDFSEFRRFDHGRFVRTNQLVFTNPFLVAYRLRFELDAFGIRPGNAIDAIRFRALAGPDANLSNGEPQGDPIMAAVLNPCEAILKDSVHPVALGPAMVATLRLKEA